jgi:hypothetical protein
VVKAFEQWPDKIGLVYADDGIHGEKGATHAFVSRQWVEAVGYYLPEILTGDFVDNWLLTLAINIERVQYLPRTYIEHRHPMANKGQWDDTYRYRWDYRDAAGELWQEVLRSGDVQVAINKLKGAMQN